LHFDEEEPNAPAVPLNLANIEIDLDGLTAFTKLMRDELEANLRPNAERINADHCCGVGFGASHAGGTMQAARDRYYTCLRQATAVLTAYVEASEYLVRAASKVSERYRDADALSAATAERVNQELASAIADGEKAKADAMVAAREQELQRRTGRLIREGIA
jgi:hypothetical protein